MSQVSKYVLRETADGIQFFATDMFNLAPAIIEFIGDDAEATFYHNSHVDLEFDDFSEVVVLDRDFIVRIGEDIEVFSEEDFLDLFVKLG